MVEICLSWMHPSTLEILKEIQIIWLLPDVTERCYQMNVIYQISLIETDFYTTDQQSFDTPWWFVPRKKFSEWVWCTLSLKSAFSVLEIIFQWVKNWKIFLFALRLFFSPYGRQFYLLCKMHFMENPTANKPKYINFFLIKFDIFWYLYLT